MFHPKSLVLSLLVVVTFSVASLLYAQEISRGRTHIPSDPSQSYRLPGNADFQSNGSWTIGSQPDQLVIRDRVLMKRTKALLAEFRQEEDSDKRRERADELKQILTEHFEIKQSIREAHLVELEARVKRLREDHDRRNAAKSTIVEKRLNHLVDEALGLGWNETDADFPNTSTRRISPTYSSVRNVYLPELSPNADLSAEPAVAAE